MILSAGEEALQKEVGFPWIFVASGFGTNGQLIGNN